MKEYYVEITYYAPRHGEYKLYNGSSKYIDTIYNSDGESIGTTNLLYLEQGETYFKIYLTVNFIPNSLFLGTNAKIVSISSDILEVGVESFSKCKYLSNLFLGGVKKINRGAFSNNSLLEEVQILKDLEIIEINAFRKNVGLQYLYIVNGEKEKQIKKYAFSKCYNLEKIIFCEFNDTVTKVNVEDLAFNDDRKLYTEFSNLIKYFKNCDLTNIKKKCYSWFYWNRQILKK